MIRLFLSIFFICVLGLSSGCVMLLKELIMILDYRIGQLAEKYETSNRGPGYISNGSKWGDPGGDSYGSYQLESNLGTLQAYLKGNDKYIKALRGLRINSSEFKAKWKEIAKQDPEGFQQSQFEFLANKANGYLDGYKYAKNKLGWNVDNLAMQSAIYSTVNQSGGWRYGIFDKAGITSEDSLKTQINKLYDARTRYIKKLTTLTQKTKFNITEKRLPKEREDCLKLIGKV